MKYAELLARFNKGEELAWEPYWGYKIGGNHVRDPQATRLLAEAEPYNAFEGAYGRRGYFKPQASSQVQQEMKGEKE